MDNYLTLNGKLNFEPTSLRGLVLRFYQTKSFINAPIKNPSAEGLTEIEVIDPMHPLFGRRFALVYLSSRHGNKGYAAVVYRGDMRLSIPISATQLTVARQRLGSKLTLESVTELVTMAQQCEELCLSLHKPSGVASNRRSKKASSTTSPSSSRR